MNDHQNGKGIRDRLVDVYSVAIDKEKTSGQYGLREDQYRY